LRSQAEAILAMDFVETVTLTGQRQYILAVIHHASRRVRILGTTAHPTLEPARFEGMRIRRRDRLGGILHEYRHAA